MRTSYRRIAGLLAGLIALCAAVAPAAAQGIGGTAPLGPASATQFTFETTRSVVIADFREPHLVRICVTQEEPASPNLGAWVFAGESQIVVLASNCGEIVGTRVTVQPADAMAGGMVRGFYSIVG